MGFSMKELGFMDYNTVFYELSTIRLEIQAMSDQRLAEECSYLSTRYRSNFLDRILDKALEGKPISKLERKDMEDFYTLINIDFGFNE
jgi:hypothetical protein